MGKIIPGDVDHIIIYIGPQGKCVEAGAKGRVIEFDLASNQWDASGMMEQRSLLDALYGIAYPLKGRGLPEEQENAIRESVGEYCLA